MTQGPVRLGAWEVVRPLGEGGMGSVFVVEHAETRARRALKLVKPGPGRDLSRARREVEALARVDGHPNVVRVHDCGEDRAQGALWIVMDLAEGGDLAARLARGPLPIPEVVTLGRALARGLAHVHARGVLHRDLKPANVLFDERGAPKLVDFGVARVDDAARLTRSGDLVGTPQYLPPEAVDGAGRGADPRTDVWGLGVVLYEALTGVPPIEATTLQEYVARVCAGRVTAPSRLRPGVPRGLEAVVLRALEADRERRLPSAEALAAALDALDADGRAPGGRGRLPAAVAALALLAAVAGAVALRRPREEPLAGPAAAAPSSAPGPIGDDRSALEPAAVVAALAREEPGPILAALEARRSELGGARCPPELRAALAGVLLVTGDRAALDGWRAAAGPELRATLDGVAGVLFGPGPDADPSGPAPPAPLPGFEGLAHELRAARAAGLASAARSALPLIDALERSLEAAESRLGAGPIDAALRVVVQRLVLARDTSLAHAARRKGSDLERSSRPYDDEGTSERACAVAARAAALSRAGPAHVALVTLRHWLLSRRPGEGGRDPRLDPPTDAEAARLAGRYPAMRFVHLSRRFVVFAHGDDEAAVRELLASWSETRDLAVRLALVTERGSPTDSARLEDTPRVSLAIDAFGAWGDLLGRQAWFGRSTPDADRLAREALAASEVVCAGNFDLGLFLAVRLHAMRGELAPARATLGRVPIQRREDGLQLAFDGELALLAGELDRAEARAAALLSRSDGLHGQVRLWGSTLAAAVEAARGRPEGAEERLRAAREWLGGRDKPTSSFCPWRSLEETARQVEAARSGWRPWVAGRPWAR